MNNVEKIYIVVVSETDRYNRKETKMFTYNSERSVLAYVGDVTRESEIERIFTVNKFGKVVHYAVVFSGKLKLVAQPENAKEGN